MSSRRVTVVGLAVLTGLSLGLAGCSDDAKPSTPAGAAAPAVPTDPKQALAASTAGLAQGNYTFTLATPEAQSKGAVHAPTNSAWMDTVRTSADAAGTTQYRSVKPDYYVKMKMDVGDAASQLKQLEGSGGNPQVDKIIAGVKQLGEMFSGKTWMHVDTSKVKDGDFPRLGGGDVLGATSLLAGVLTAERSGNTITGTLDATRKPDTTGPIDPDELKQLKDKATSLPYTATIDEQGRLLSLAMDVPAVEDTPAGQRILTITGYGNGTPAEKPTGADVTEMTDDAYDMATGA